MNLPIEGAMMEITTGMLQAAMKKAIEAGLLPRNSTAAEQENSLKIMHAIVEAALDATSDEDGLAASMRTPQGPARYSPEKER